jgi:hypothetical protein
MRLSWRRSSRAEDRFETWITQHHQARVLAGETTPVGPCPDEVFLRDLARKSKRIALSDPRVDHAASCPTCVGRLLILRQENRSRRRKLVIGVAAGCFGAADDPAPLQRAGPIPGGGDPRSERKWCGGRRQHNGKHQQ